MLTRGAVAMDALFPDDEGSLTLVSRLVSRSQAHKPQGLEHDDERQPDRVELRGLEPLTSSMPWWPGRRKRRAASVDGVPGRAGGATSI